MAARIAGGVSRHGLPLRRLAGAAVVMALAGSIAGCQSMKDAGSEVAARGGGLVAQMKGTQSAATGVARIVNYRDGVVFQLAIDNLIPGTYRVALHERGNCRSPNLFSAGPAWAPPGWDKPPGDLLPQFVVNEGGNVNEYVAYIKGVRTDGPTSMRGRSVVIHWGNSIADAFPGQANNRFACGVLENANPLFERDN
ncbi:MAG: superoxide dismutase family protein [Casimicrobiaceae bacterium]